MPENNQARSEFVIRDLDERIDRQNDTVGVGRTSQLQTRIDHVNELNDAYKPAIEGLDNKIVSIGQSINTIKDEIIVLITNAVGTSTVSYCGIVDTSSCGIGTSISGIGSTVHPWNGGISTCLIGYATEYYDSVTAYIWPFSSTSTNPFSPQTTEVLSNANNSYTLGIGTFILHQSNNSSYEAGVRVSLGSSATCADIQTEIDRKDGEISALRTEIDDYISKVNDIRADRVRNQLEEWGSNFAQQEAIKEKSRLENVKSVYTDPKYRNLFLQ
jgi:hypothetical protein